MLAVALAAGLGLAGCSRPAREGFALRPLVAAERYSVGKDGEGPGLSFGQRPRLDTVEIDHERRRAVITGPGRWSWRGRVPAGARLVAGVQALPGASAGGLEAMVTLRDGREREVLDVARSRDPAAPGWLALAADLSQWAGREVSLEFSAAAVAPGSGVPVSSGNPVAVAPPAPLEIAWAPVSLFAAGQASGERGASRRPNVLFILVDTLRRDRLTPYGYRRDTSPEIARLIAAPGAVVEEAYSQAPWTLPSVVSLLTGRYPGELLGENLSSYGIPDRVTSLPERLAALGYETGAFIGNPSLHAGAGFERGFGTFFAPPGEVEWMRRHADLVNAHALPWLAAHAGGERPFFAYVHYIDPHDPYESPEVVDNQSPFLPGYTGPVTGVWVHGIYTGRLALPDPPRDIEHLSALYDSEVHYVDGRIGELLAAIPPEVLADTLVVLTADHGEELHDHGGWKHGQTLYEEQIHVPLLLRWDGRIPAGQRLPGTVRLLDLAPTIMAAAGGRPDPRWSGVDLLPALTGKGPLPERPAISQHLASGPLRAAAVSGRRKLILFDREAPFTPEDDLQAHLWQVDLGRLARAEVYDLARDPAERRNLAGGLAGSGPRLAGALYRQLDRQLPGLRVVAGAAPAGSRLDGTIRFERPPQGWTPLFLAAGDRVSLAGDRLDFDLASEPLDKGFLVLGDFGAVRSIEARRDGVPLPSGSLRVGEGVPYGGGAVPPARLLAAGWPLADGRDGTGLGGATGQSGDPAGLALWLHRAARAGERRTERDPETERRLRALGYI
jgi:arylsulfatase A-like enzyme